jgi:phosphatidylglycerol:prolipoprotein diacylglycerol transferase
VNIAFDEARFAWVYAATALLAIALLFLVPTARAVPAEERGKYAILQVVTLFAAAVGAKVSMLAGDLGWPWVPLPDGVRGWHQIVDSGRSITGGLVLGFVAAEAVKPLLAYRAPPNDTFAAKLPFSIALGRVGCFFGGCCRGVAWAGPLTVTYADGVARFPAQLVEVVFQLLVGAVFVGLVRGRVRALRGRVFALYLVFYGAFRFATEPFRVTPKPLGGLSVYQILALVMIGLGTASFALRARKRAHVDALEEPAPEATTS